MKGSCYQDGANQRLDSSASLKIQQIEFQRRRTGARRLAESASIDQPVDRRRVCIIEKDTSHVERPIGFIDNRGTIVDLPSACGPQRVRIQNHRAATECSNSRGDAESTGNNGLVLGTSTLCPTIPLKRTGQGKRACAINLTTILLEGPRQRYRVRDRQNSVAQSQLTCASGGRPTAQL